MTTWGRGQGWNKLASPRPLIYLTAAGDDQIEGFKRGKRAFYCIVTKCTERNQKNVGEIGKGAVMIPDGLVNA